MSKFFHFILGLIFIICGFVLWISPVESVLALSFYIGFIYLGIAITTYLVDKKLNITPMPYGNIVLSLICGLAFLFLPKVSVIVLTWLFIAAFIAVSIYYLVNVFKKNKHSKWHFLQLIISILGLISGIYMLLFPTVALISLGQIIAILVIFNGVSYLFTKGEPLF